MYIKDILKSFFRKKIVVVLSIAIEIVGLCAIFFAGSFNDSVQSERLSNYISNVVKNNTDNKKYCAVSIDAPNKGAEYYSNELVNLFDVFKSGVVSYTSGMNINKEYDIHIDEMRTGNLSLMFLGPIGSMKQYDGEKCVFRHHMYNIYTMFSDPQYNNTEYDFNHCSVAYISVEQADYYLEHLNIEKEYDNSYSLNQYKQLLKTPINIWVNNTCCTYYIWNIYFNTGFYCDGLRDVLGEYILTSYYQPMNLRDIHKTVYFFNDNSYYNEFLMRYLNTRFKDEPEEIRVVRNNIISEIDETYFLSFFLNEFSSKFQWVFNMILVFGISLFLFSFLMNFYLFCEKLLFILLYFGFSFIPYLFFKILFLVVGDPLFFSELSCKINLAIILIASLLAISIYLFARVRIKKRKIDIYEVSI